MAIVLLPFAFAYFFSYFFRVVYAVVAPHLTAKIGLNASEPGLLSAAYFFTFAAFQIPIPLRCGFRIEETAGNPGFSGDSVSFTSTAHEYDQEPPLPGAHQNHLPRRWILYCGDGSVSVFDQREHDHSHAQMSLFSAWHSSTNSASAPSSSFGLPTRMASIPRAPVSLRFSLSSLRRLQH